MNIDDRPPTSVSIHTFCKNVNRSPSCLFSDGVFGDGGSSGAISGSLKSKMAAGGHLGKLQMAISQQRIIRFTECMHTDHILPSVSNI